MDTFARNALRLSLAGAGIAVLGAGFVGQASAAEIAPNDVANSNGPDTSSVENQLDGATAPSRDNNVSVVGQQVAGQEADAPSADSLPSLADTQTFQVPSVADLG